MARARVPTHMGGKIKMKNIAIAASALVFILIPGKTFSTSAPVDSESEPVTQEKTTTKYSENSKYWAKKLVIDNAYSDGPCSGHLELGEGATKYWTIDQSDLGEWCFYLDNVSNNGDVILKAGGAFSPNQVLALGKDGEEKYSYDADDLKWEISLEYSKSGNVMMVYKENRTTHERNWEFVNLLSGGTWEKPLSYFSPKGLFGHPQIAKDDKVFIVGDYKGEYTGVYNSEGVRLWDKPNSRLRFMYNGNILMSAPPNFDVLKRENGKVIKHWSIKSQPFIKNGEEILFDDSTIAFTSDFKYYAAASIRDRKKNKKLDRYIGLFNMDGNPIGIKQLEKIVVYLTVRISEDDKQVIVTDPVTLTHPEESVSIAELLATNNQP